MTDHTVSALTNFLLQYGTHMHDCKMQNFRDETDCTCGWRQLEAHLNRERSTYGEELKKSVAGCGDFS